MHPGIQQHGRRGIHRRNRGRHDRLPHLKAKGIPVNDIAKMLGVSRATTYRHLKLS
ncbi:MAG TPA: hypothetical protein DCL83_10790 [Arthrobacter bacterium]|nr:hypothetical protein [Arthrobacter sp.]HBH56835.1 hypothetical protein [Arthrobacter sp.]